MPEPALWKSKHVDTKKCARDTVIYPKQDYNPRPMASEIRIVRLTDTNTIEA